MAESIASSKEDDYNCKIFYTGFLDPVSLDLRKETVRLIHELSKHHGTKEQCTEVIIKMETELGKRHICCEMVAKKFAECLQNADLLEDAVSFLKDRIGRLGSEDFGCLLTLGNIYEKSGKYREATVPRNKALHLAKEAGDPVLENLALLKQACNLWHSKVIEKAKENIQSCLNNMQVWSAQSECLFPFTDTTLRIIDIYKTLGYIHIAIKEPSKSAEYYIKALHIVEKDKDAVIQQLQLETQIAKAFNSLGGQQSQHYYTIACTKLKEIECDEDFMGHHILIVIHTMSRLAYSLQMADKADLLPDVLKLREDSYTLAVKYLDPTHPEVARIAADIANFSCDMNEKLNTNNSEKGKIYADRAKSALSTTKSDREFLKLHVRELSDAWKSLGQYYSRISDFLEGEKCLQEALTVNYRAYGRSHPRLSILYREFACLYKKSGRFSEANAMFCKCKKINDEFYPDDISLRKKTQAQIRITNSLDRKSRLARK